MGSHHWSRQLGTLMWLSSCCYFKFHRPQTLTSDDFWSAASGPLRGHFDLQSNVPLSDFIVHTVLRGLQSIWTPFTPRTPEMNDSRRDKEVDEEVEKKSTKTMLIEPSNPAPIEMRLCAGRISLLQAKVHDLQEENRLLRARSRYGSLLDSGGFKQETFQRKILPFCKTTGYPSERTSQMALPKRPTILNGIQYILLGINAWVQPILGSVVSHSRHAMNRRGIWSSQPQFISMVFEMFTSIRSL